ncbi:MAG TPA: RbsD/FucU domain-containing protein [Terracidiphilus sp.]|nr:RbsD/FucU domain-containing protein [Terracidiphilus sp.]
MTGTKTSDWKTHLSATMPLFGHRNWIVVADSAYPAQSKPGIETIVSGDDQLHVVQHVLDAIAACSHIRANVYADRELALVPQIDAPGIEDYRKQLDAILQGARVQYIPHDQIIAKLDQSAQVFRILLIKTEMTIPYTTVFFELDCGYWNADAEQRLRQVIAAMDSK